MSPEPSLNRRQEEEARASATQPTPAERLDEVLAVLNDAPGVQVEPMSVLSAINAHPDLDPVRSAYEVKAWAHEGGLRIRAAGRLLMAALDREERHQANLTAIRQHAYDEETARRSALRNGHTPRASSPEPTLADLGDELLAEAFANQHQQEEAQHVER